MARFYSFFLLVFSVMVWSGAPVSAQNEGGGLYLSGKVTTEQGSVDGAVIRISRNSQRIKDYNIGRDGKFNLYFEFNYEFELIFVRADNFPQKIVVSTVVPAEVVRRDPKFPAFPLEINLFTEIKGVDRTFSENTVMRIYYSAAVDNFIPEVYYNSAQIKKLIDQAILQSQNLGRAVDALKKLTDAEMAILKKEYDEHLRKAGQLFDQSELPSALLEYQAASRIFPKEQYPKDRIAEINDLMAALGIQQQNEKAMAEKYGQLIRQADQLFDQKDYQRAKDIYNQTLAVKLNDAHASGRMAEIDRLLAEIQAQQRYADLVALADKAFEEKLWDQARTRYQEALQLRPAENYPKSQLAKIEAELHQLAQSAEKQANFNNAVLQGDASYQKQFYSKAIAFYQTALTYKPGDPGVLAKIARIEKEQKEIADKLFYDELIAKADKVFKDKNYAQAKEFYSSALTARPDQAYPKKQIEVIDNLLEKDRQYTELIARADEAFSREAYEPSLEAYQQALALKSSEDYPKQKIKVIDSILAGMAKADLEYRQVVAAADKLFNSKMYPQARGEYQKAQGMKPSEDYPKEMLAKIDSVEAEQARLAAEQKAAEQARLLAQQQQKDQLYQQTIAEADRLAGNNELVSAVGKFRSALEIKPQESYPIQRIEEIRGMIARQADEQKAYDAAIAAADRDFQAKQYPAARNAYKQAQQAKPAERYPGEMLAKIDSIEAEQSRLVAEQQAAQEAARLAALAEKDRQYAEAVSRGDALFNQQKYPESATEYRAALKVKPDEQYPKDKIAEGDRLHSALAAAQKTYDAAIVAADRDFQRKQYASAKTFYTQAQQAKPAERYPGEMLAKIDSIEAEQTRLVAEQQVAEEAARLAALAEKDRQYAEAVSRGDALFNQQKYPESGTEYRAALKVKPDEQYPKDKIAEGDRLHSALAAAQKTYDAAIVAADRDFQRKQYASAKTFYTQAQQAKPAERYPGEMLAKIDSIEAEQTRLVAEQQAAEEAARLAALAEKDRQYAEAVSRGDALFNQKKYPEATLAYQSASKVKPEEQYPQDQIKKMEELKAAELVARFDSLLADGDQALQSENFDAAENNFREAAKLLPSDTRPKERIAETDRLRKAKELALKEEDSRNRNYERYIQLADKAFDSRQLPVAASNYRSALGIKSEALYPQQRLALIDSLNRAQENEERYRSLLLAADGAFRSKDYETARQGYESALAVKPQEEYPQKQLREIEEILQRLSRQASVPEKQPEVAPSVAPAVPASEGAASVQGNVGEENEALYAGYIQTADETFGKKAYNVSRAWYYRALDVKPAENYPRQQINKINQLLGEQMVTQRDREFQQYIDQGDEAYRKEQLAVARSWYSRALGIKPGEAYPKSKIEEIQQKVNERLLSGTDRQYQDYLRQANEAYEQKQYGVARVWYQRARQLKPSETLPQERLEAIRKLLNE